MKEKLLKWSKPLMLACMALDIWVTVDVASVFFFGEYEHPKKISVN